MSKSVMGQSYTKWLNIAGEMTDPCGSPACTWYEGKKVSLVEARSLPDTEVCHKTSNQIVSESGAVDHLNNEAVRICVERL